MVDTGIHKIHLFHTFIFQQTQKQDGGYLIHKTSEMLDQMHLSLHKTSTTKETEGYFLKPYYTFSTLTI